MSVMRACTADLKKRRNSCRKSKNWRNDMILLRHDCLVFKTMDGECIPCSSEEVTLEIIGDAIGLLDENVIKEASAGVLHYFKEELGKTTVTVAEFAGALERALRALGLNVQNSAAESAPAPRPSWRIARSNLSELAGGPG